MRQPMSCCFFLAFLSIGLPQGCDHLKKQFSQANIFEEASIWKILLHIAPPVMLAQLIQAMYNIVDSYFVGRYSGDGLTALSVIYPVQLIIVGLRLYFNARDTAFILTGREHIGFAEAEI